MNNYYGGGRGVRTVILLIIAILMIGLCATYLMRGSSVSASTANRERLETGISFQNDCVIDDLGWVDNESRTERNLQYFFDKTGVQPVVYFKAYDPSLTTDSEKQAFAEDWYEANIQDESSFVFTYFCEQNEDDVGYMTYVCGKQAVAVMDSEAVDIFWNYMDMNWFSDKSTDDVINDTFKSTADRIMERTKTGTDIFYVICVAGTVIGIGIVVVMIMKTKRKHDAAAAAEAERILKADLGDLSGDDDVLNKYQ